MRNRLTKIMAELAVQRFLWPEKALNKTARICIMNMLNATYMQRTITIRLSYSATRDRRQLLGGAVPPDMIASVTG